ncbi:ATP-grasp fold amidoligase family protein [Marinimicrobium sp. ABcell2]|uniref:ATP-grasp fold amidoligase family protein n=1 Tax=Marinimicrobium sp. ABcell2 TaxID=3069751 RepID=UPI0027AF7D42|nr:ATP-grasp fold amidoligase family protein [Marinimicrobium sp. ABcell2]MDQ2078333.1 ATP-grasp fold amidoligase family protein [Marinimicrobium sp. ABcell2]
MSEVEFDRPDADSSFLTFVRNEFQKRGTPLRKKLANKHSAAQEVQKLGLKVPKKLRILENIEDLKPWHLKRRAVLKYGRGWSARGVMLLERKGINRYFDHLSLQKYALQSIKEHQARVAKSFGSKDPNWILEELLEPTHAFGAVPYDYKFYVFGGQIGLILQVDRNTTPPKQALFDGSFKPLHLGVDYLLTGKSCQPGLPIVPPHATELMWWALKLASITDSPFVSIDLYDTPQGPVFGEFTFSPGATHKRMFTLSKRLIDYYDELFNAAEKRLEEGVEVKRGQFDTDMARFVDLVATADYKTLARTSKIPTELYKTWSGVAYNRGSIGALRLSEYFRNRAEAAEDQTEKAIYTHLSSAWESIQKEVKAHTRKYKAMAATP